jgi:hypothetical protein
MEIEPRVRQGLFEIKKNTPIWAKIGNLHDLKNGNRRTRCSHLHNSLFVDPWDDRELLMGFWIRFPIWVRYVLIPLIDPSAKENSQSHTTPPLE